MVIKIEILFPFLQSANASINSRISEVIKKF